MTKKKETIIVGMSGGVDSSVAALLLKRQGYDVSGLFMKNWDEDDGTEYCTAKEDLKDTEHICDQLGIPLHIANFSSEYWDNVFEIFVKEYEAGRTPNPDVLCNREIKFKQFLNYAKTLGADKIATGHYARSTLDQGAFQLLKGLDPKKDQSYFLVAVTANALKDCLFPVGGLIKSKVRAIAKELKFENWEKKDSTGICFIGERRFSEFLSRYVAQSIGPIKNTEGITIGEHIGTPYYTIGQRQGLRIGGIRGGKDAAWYVVRKDTTNNEIIATQNPSDLNSSWLEATEMNWLRRPTEFPHKCKAKIRYQQPDQDCRITHRANGQYLVSFESPQRAVAPGQYIAFYEADICLGGGLINSTSNDHSHGS